MDRNTALKDTSVPKRRESITPGPEASLGGRLQRARKKHELSITEVAKRTGISKSSLTRYESGERNPGTTELRLLCDELEVSPQSLIYGDEAREFGPLRETFLDREIKTDEQFGAIATALILSLPRPDRAALMQLLFSLAVERIGESQWNKIEQLLMEFASSFKLEAETIAEREIAKRGIDIEG